MKKKTTRTKPLYFIIKKKIFNRTAAVGVKVLHFGLATVSQRLVAAIQSSHFFVADWSESQELGL